MQKGKLSKSGDVGPSTLNRVIGPKKSRPILRGKKETEEAIDNAFEYTSANPEGFSIDLGTKTNYHQPGYYVSPYPSKSLVKTGTLTKKEINDFIIKNKTLLKKEEHFLGGWVDGDVIHLDVTIKVKKGVAAQVVDGTDEALAKAQYLGIIGKQAEIVEAYVGKGTNLYVEGSIDYRKYTDKSGVEKYTIFFLSVFGFL